MKGFWKKKLPACLLSLALLMGTVPMASAAWADLTYDVDEDDYVFIGADDFEDLFDEEWDGWDSFEYLEFRNIDDFDDYGYFTAEDGDGYNAQLDSDDLYDGIFYSNGRDAEDWDEYDLDTLYFETYDNIDSDTIYIDFTLYGYDEDVDGTMCIDIAGGSGSSGDVELTYYVDPGDDVELDADDFWDLFDEESREDFEYLEFYSYDDFDDYGYFEFEDFDGRYDYAEYSDLDEYRFYYDYYYYVDDDDPDLDSLYFVTEDDIYSDSLDFDIDLYGSEGWEEATIRIDIEGGSKSSSGDVELTYYVDPGDDVTVDADDFSDLFDEESRDYFYYLEFTDYDDFDDYGYFEADGYDDYEDYVRDYELNNSDLDDAEFYYEENNIRRNYEFELDTLTFCADRYADEDTLSFDFTMWGEYGDRVDGTLYIEIGDGKGTSGSVKADFVYQVDPYDDVTLDAEEFDDFFWDESDDDELAYIEFTDYDDFDDYGWFEADGVVDDEDYRGYELNESDLDYGIFYYSSRDVRDDYEFELETLTFCADRYADEDVLIFDITMHGVYGEKVYATLAIEIGDAGSGAAAEGGDIRYYGSYSGRVQINANDIARFFQESYPGYTLQYVTIDDVPEAGTLYYNYYGTSQYGTSYNLRMTEALCDELDFYFSPSSSQYALSELTYVPSGVNYCARIPFTAHGSGSRSVSGTILISVNLSEVPDVYGPTPVNTSVTFPAASIATAVSQASGLTLSSIQLLELPAANEGTIYVGSSQRADTDTLYGYTSGNVRISQLRFVPASGFTGSVEIPYVACNASGDPIASGKLCLGVVRQMEDFSDITSSTWCYKYVLELSDAGVIDGYDDGTFKPNSQVTYGAALKLIMLAAGYAEQAPTGSNVFSGYLARAQEDGLVSGSVNLSAPITRLAVSQIAAKALGLSITNLSSVRPFTDTTDPYVQALNAAGIVEGYFSNGTSTFKPYNTLTRGQISAIVWRMEQLG